MKELKQIVIDDILERINSSPFLIVTNYAGMTVPQFENLRDQLKATGARFSVAKNTFVKRAASSAEYPEGIAEFLTGQSAFVTGEEDVCAAAKTLKAFAKTTAGRPGIRGAVLDGVLLSEAQVIALADLPSKEVLQSQFLGLLNTPAQNLVRILNEPASALARVLQAKADQG